MSELRDAEVFSTGWTRSSGTQATLYSAYKPATIDRHFAWMQEHDLDGVMLQRFVCDLHDEGFRDFRNQVAANVKAGAEAHSRAFCIMYDITGSNEVTLLHDLKDDWAYLADTLKIADSQQYLHHNGKPLIAIWGLGFSDRPGTAAQANEIISHFKNNQLTVLGGVPTHWRTPGDPNSDAKPGLGWAEVYTSLDVVSPWSVGRYSNEAESDSFMRRQIIPDLNMLSSRGIDYMPVVFPGFSFWNKGGHQIEGQLNKIPRNAGRFWWQQVYNAIKAFKEVKAKNTMIYGAMFDEVDEGTAMFKLVANRQDLPVQAQDDLVYLSIDGESLRNDYYLWLADQGGKMLRGEIQLTAKVPTQVQGRLPVNWFRRALSRMKRHS
jgi:hypothetical protein